MSCNAAMIELKDVVIAKSDLTVGEIVSLLEENNLRAVPVVDDNNKLLGMFSTRILLRNLLPASVTMQDGLQRLNFVIGAAPSLARLLSKINKDLILDHIDPNPVVLHLDTPMWEIIRLLTEHGSPLPVVNKADGTLEGLISDQSILGLLNKSADDIEAAKTR